MLRLPALATGLIVAWLATLETGPEAYPDPESFVTAGCAAADLPAARLTLFRFVRSLVR